MMKPILFLILSCLCILPTMRPAGAEQTDHCHCFRNRDYDPADKFAADDYLLTTSYNSLIAATLGVSKRQIVMKKMKGGIDPDELLIALYIANKTDTNVNLLLSVRANGGSWQTVIKAPALQKKAVHDPVLTGLANAPTDTLLSQQITDSMLTTLYHTTPEYLKKLHSQGFTDKEITLITALHAQKNVPAQEIADMFQQKKMSWSEIAHHFQLTPSEVGKKITAQ